MKKLLLNKTLGKSKSAVRLGLSIAVPAFFLLAFLGSQIYKIDGIGWTNGFSHPLSGWDHLVTMLGVGIWAAQLRGQAIWMLPLAFVGVMSLGGIAGAAGICIPSVEGIILLSCAVFSVLISRKIRFNAKINVTIVAFFAFFHGFAHGQEISASASLISYTLGFMLATLLLHGAGILVAKLVILSITCIIGAMFSTAAIAEARASSAQNYVLVNDDCSGQYPAEFSEFPRAGFTQRQFHGYPLSIGENDAAVRIKKDDDGPAGTYLLDELAGLDQMHIDAGHVEKGLGHGGSVGLLAELKYYPVAIDRFFLLAAVMHAVIFLSFNSIYPSINNTPGSLLLSNGVGLNSPPIANPAPVSSQVSSYFRSTPRSFLEDFCLQLALVSIVIGQAHFPVSTNNYSCSRVLRAHWQAVFLNFWPISKFQPFSAIWCRNSTHRTREVLSEPARAMLEYFKYFCCISEVSSTTLSIKSKTVKKILFKSFYSVMK